MASSDIERLEHILKRPNETAVIHIIPDYSNIDLSDLAGKQYSTFWKQVKIYQDFSLEAIRHKFFQHYCNFTDHEKHITGLGKIDFL